MKNPFILTNEVITLSGRVIHPPNIRVTTPRIATKDCKAADIWLRNEAINEAETKNDNWNLFQFKCTNKDSHLTTADRELMHVYLFGDVKYLFCLKAE